MDQKRSERRLAAIMFTDIVGYTALMARDEEAARRARDHQVAVVPPLVERHHGHFVEATGDESLSSFPSALLFGSRDEFCSTQRTDQSLGRERKRLRRPTAASNRKGTGCPTDSVSFMP